MQASSLILPIALLNVSAVIAETESSQLKADPQLVAGRLDNGLSYFIRPNAEPKGRVSVRLRVNTGSLNETSENAGISHFIEHMVFNGSRRFKRNELIPAMQKRGLGLGGDANAYTSLSETVYSIDIPKLDEDTTSFALNILRDFADGASLEEDSINSERGVIRAELKARDSMKYRSMIESLGYLLDGTKVADFMPIGREEVIMNMPRQAFLDYYKKHYVASDMHLIIVGDITVEQGKAWAEKYFGDMVKAPKPAPADRGQLSPRKRDAKIIVNPEASSTSITLAKVIPYKKVKDSVQQRISEMPLRLAHAIVGQRLSKMTEEETCPFKSAGIWQSDLMQLADVVNLAIDTSPETWKEALKSVEQELRRALEFGFYESELDVMKKALIAELEASVKSWQTQDSAKLAGNILSGIADDDIFTAPEEDLRIAKLALENLSAENCHKALKTAWAQGVEQLCISGKDDKLTVAEALAVLDESKTQPVTKQVERKLGSFAYDELGTPGKVVAKSHVEDLDITQLTLSNGIKVNLKPTTFDKNGIHMSVQIDGGKLSAPKGKPGLEGLASQVMMMGGLEAHSMEELQKILAEKRVGWLFSVGADKFSYTGTTTPQDVEAQLKLLMAQIQHPGFRPEAEVKFRRSVPSIYQQIMVEPMGVFQMKGMRYLVSGDYRLASPEEKEILSRTTQEVKDWVSPALASAQMELSIVGDFKVDEMISLLEKTLGSLPQRAVKRVEAEVAAVDIVAAGSKLEISYPSQVDRTLVTKAWQFPDAKDKKQTRRLMLLKDILKDRLFLGIRQKLGEAYSPFVQLQQSEVYPNMGLLLVISPGVKDNQAKVGAAIDEIVSAMAKGDITQDELDRVRKPGLSGLDKMFEGNDLWLTTLADVQENPERLVNLRGLREDMRAVTAEELNVLAKKWLSPKSINVDIVPEQVKPPVPEQKSQAIAPVESDYVVLISKKTNEDPAWRQVAETLKKNNKGRIIVSPSSIENSTAILKKADPRALAIVAKPEEVNRETVNFLHRVTRQLDADAYGDCIWGVVTGFSPADAQRIADAKDPLIIKRIEGTTNVDATPYEQSMCITDWGPFEVMEQEGYKPAAKIAFPQTDQGMVFKFAEYFEKAKPQLLVTSSHATQYNLEMPFEKGLIVSFDNKFHILKMSERNEYAQLLRGVLFDGNEPSLEKLIKANNYPVMKADSSPKVWIAAGNCLFGDANNTKNSMVVTALSAYGCNQVVGYTVPSWRGIGGWGTLDLFTRNHDKSSLAEAWYLNNQFILLDTLSKYPKLMQVEFNSPDISTAQSKDPKFLKGIIDAGYAPSQDTIGLVHDRDTVAFYGDPRYQAQPDQSHVQAPFSAKWGDKTLTITGNADAKQKFAFWLPERVNFKTVTMLIDGKPIDIKTQGVATNDFVLLNNLELTRGQSAVITYK